LRVKDRHSFEGVPREGARPIENDCDDISYHNLKSSGRTECRDSERLTVLSVNAVDAVS
jgi:hypothetical protein